MGRKEEKAWLVSRQGLSSTRFAVASYGETSAADSKCRVCVVCVYVCSRHLCKRYLSKLTPSQSVWLRENGEGCLTILVNDDLGMMMVIHITLQQPSSSSSSSLLLLRSVIVVLFFTTILTCCVIMIIFFHYVFVLFSSYDDE